MNKLVLSFILALFLSINSLETLSGLTRPTNRPKTLVWLTLPRKG
jgi:hypothetical protein